MTMNDLAEKSILILGFGREGISTYQYLRFHFPNKTLAIADAKNLNDLDKETQKLINNDGNLKLLFADSYLTELNSYQVIFKTPGMPQFAQLLSARDRGCAVTSNTQLFLDLCPGKTIGITGTKGKSTTTALIYHILKTAGLDAVMLGNMGVPPLSQLDKIKQDTIAILELSSHQLADLKSSPNIAVILNIFPEHLDYFDSLESYLASKSAITKYQKQTDAVIFNPSYTETNEIARLSKGEKITFSQDDCKKAIAHQTLPLLGEHNLQNIMPAIIVAQYLGINKEKIINAVKSFKGLPHRLEFVAIVNGVKFYNDSQGTNPEATIAALNSFPNKKIILIAGGHEKNLNYSQLAQVILEKKIKALILFKPTGEQILKELKEKTSGSLSSFRCEFANSMSEAVSLAIKYVQSDDIVLLSPASSSFGMFKDYQDRGNQFKDAVFKLAPIKHR